MKLNLVICVYLGIFTASVVGKQISQQSNSQAKRNDHIHDLFKQMYENLIKQRPNQSQGSASTPNAERDKIYHVIVQLLNRPGGVGGGSNPSQAEYPNVNQNQGNLQQNPAANGGFPTGPSANGGHGDPSQGGYPCAYPGGYPCGQTAGNAGYPPINHGQPGGNAGYPPINHGQPGGNAGYPPINQGMLPGMPPAGYPPINPAGMPGIHPGAHPGFLPGGFPGMPPMGHPGLMPIPFPFPVMPPLFPVVHQVIHH